MRIAVACLVLLLSVPAVAEDQSKPDEGKDAEKDDSELTTEAWREPDVPLGLGWQLLALPEHFVELTFTPFALAVGAVERYRLDLRFYEALRNDAGTIVVSPRFKFSGSDGLGGGAKLKLEKLTTDESKLVFGGLRRLNADYELSAEYEQTLAFLEGRDVAVVVEYELDQDQPYYGIGNETAERQDVEDRELRARLEFDVTKRGAQETYSIGRIGYLRQKLFESSAMPLDPAITPPPGLGRTIDYLNTELEFDYDTRDTESRTTRGILARFVAGASLSSDDVPVSGARLTTNLSWYKQILPRERIIILSAGAGVAVPLGDDDDIPLHQLVTLGRKNHLRGYSRGRLLDKYGWWSSAEYRFPIWEYQASGAALIPSIFVDVGQIGSDVSDVFASDLFYNGGIGLRGEHYNFFFFAFELGYSPEGPELGFSLGTEL